MPVGGDQPHRLIVAPRNPTRHLGRVRSRVLGLEAQGDAAVEQLMRASIFGGKFLWLHRARDAADQQALRLPGLEQFERAVDAAGTAGQHDDRVGRSEEHTSELQSLMRISYAVFCLKKKSSH